MEAHEVLSLAEAFLNNEKIDYLRCIGQTTLRDEDIPVFCGGEHGVLPGTPKKVWFLEFLQIEHEPGVAVSGGTCLVLVNDETKECGFFQRL